MGSEGWPRRTSKGCSVKGSKGLVMLVNDMGTTPWSPCVLQATLYIAKNASYTHF